MEEKKKSVCIKVLQNGKRCDKVATQGSYCDDHVPLKIPEPHGGGPITRRDIHVSRLTHRD